MLPRQNPLPSSARPAVLWTCRAFTAALLAAGLWTLWQGERPLFRGEHADWWPSTLWLLAGGSTLAALGRHLPLQNVLFAGLLIALAGGATAWLDTKTGMPFGPVTFLAQPKLFGAPAVLPLIWTVAVLNSRGVARLILKPWRTHRDYGFRLIGLTAGLTALFDLALEPFATRVNHFWVWSSTRFPLAWQGVPLVNFFSWAVVTALILAFVTPLLIPKQPHPSHSPDFHPLGVWMGGVLFFGAGCAAHGLWAAAALDAILGAVVALLAIRGGR